MATENGASATSGKYLMEIKAIYERLKGEYEYLRKKQEHQYHQPLDDLEAELGRRIGKTSLNDNDNNRNGDNNLDSDGLDALEGQRVDEAIVSSVEELVESENATLREKVAELEAEVAAKNRDWKRIRASYEQLQEANEKLKQQLNESNTERSKLDTRYKNLQSRFANLQTFRLCRSVDESSTASKPLSTTTSKSTGKSTVGKPSKGDVEKLLNFALEALAEVSAAGVHLAPKSSTTSTNMIFALAELLRNLPPSLASQSRVVDPLLRLFYDALPWTMSSGEESGSDLRPGVNLSLQKCGETLFRWSNTSAAASAGSESTSVAMETVSGRRPAAVFFRSSQISTRFLSTLIILRTVTRADILAQALDSLLRDCQSEVGREAFIRFDASRVVVLFLRPHNKAFVGISLAIIVRLLSANTTTPLSNPFIDQFLTERFVCALSMLLDSASVVGEDLDKLSIVLSKLAATVRRQKSSGTATRLFNAFGVIETIQRMLKRLPSEETAVLSPLVIANFRQIVLNLAVPPTSALYLGANNGGEGSSMMAEDDLSCGSLLLQ